LALHMAVQFIPKVHIDEIQDKKRLA